MSDEALDNGKEEVVDYDSITEQIEGGLEEWTDTSRMGYVLIAFDPHGDATSLRVNGRVSPERTLRALRDCYLTSVDGLLEELVKANRRVQELEVEAAEARDRPVS